MNNKNISKAALVVCLLLFVITIVGYQADSADAQTGSFCASHPNRVWGWTLEGAWMSTNKTGDWKTDDWFYMLKSGEPIAVLQYDGINKYYLICLDIDGDNGWQPLFGWVQKEKVLLQSEITPMP